MEGTIAWLVVVVPAVFWTWYWLIGRNERERTRFEQLERKRLGQWEKKGWMKIMEFLWSRDDPDNDPEIHSTQTPHAGKIILGMAVVLGWTIYVSLNY